jgi:hypothetical protein
MRLFNYLLFILIVCTACNNKQDSKTSTKEPEKITKAVKNTKEVVNNASSTKDNLQELRKTEHLTKEQFEAWLPEKLLGLPRTSTTINSSPEFGSCAAFYTVGNTRIHVKVFDGAGERGASAVGVYRMLEKMEYDNTYDYGYRKTRMIDGAKVKENYFKPNRYTIMMFYGERFGVDIETHEIEHDQLEEIFKELNLNGLIKL